MQIEATCEYCGHRWEIRPIERIITCPICKDKNVKIKDLSKHKIDYYQGSPPFKNLNDKEDDGDGGDGWGTDGGFFNSSSGDYF